MDKYYDRNWVFFGQFRTIVINVADPGAWAVLSLFSKLLCAKGHRVKYIFDGWALDTVSSRYPDHLKLLSCEPVQTPCDEISLLIYGARRNFSANYRMVDMCRQWNISTFFIFDHWKNNLLNFRDPKNGTMHLPTRISVIDEYQRNCLKRELGQFVSRDYFRNVDLLGQPAVEQSVAAINDLSVSGRKALQKKYNPKGKHLTLLVLEPIRDDFGKDFFPGYDEFTTTKIFFSHCCSSKMRILIKPHPRHDKGTIAAFLHSLSDARTLDYVTVIDEKVEHLVAIADEVYGMTSIALIAAIWAGKKTTSLQVGRNAYGRTLSNPILEPHALTASAV